MTRVAAIDCGTNSIRLLVTDGGTDLVRTMEIVRLGEGVDRTGRLAPAAIERTLAALRRYADTAAALGATRVRMVATSATRDAANREEFVAGATAILGVAPEVLSGPEEAALSYAGATADLDPERFPPPYAVVDVGGGSTEVVVGAESASVDIGCVRLTERCLHSDPPAADQVAAAELVVAAALDRIDATVGVRRARTLVGLAGSVTTVAALALDLPAYDPEAIHLARVSRADVERVAGMLLAMPHAARAALPVMHPGRVDVIGGGALVLREVLRRWDFGEVVASERDILDGIALSIA